MSSCLMALMLSWGQDELLPAGTDVELWAG